MFALAFATYTTHPVYLKTDGMMGQRRTTGQDGASLPQLAAISSPWWRDGADDGSTGQPDIWRRDK